ncbi:MAG: glutamate-ammonia-ligase adenylyltransferase [Halioglobus sp.]|jgi:glutamate-ammonia-ligase adenylyltransferase
MSASGAAFPKILAEESLKAWSRIQDFWDADTLTAVEKVLDEKTSEQLSHILAYSPFIADLIQRKPDIFLQLLRENLLNQAMDELDFSSALSDLLQADGCELAHVLRRFRAYHMLRIVWRDFCRLADTHATMRETSLLAEACIAQALLKVQGELEERLGRPVGTESGERQQLIVLAMGKLGARELNVSSDIDLIFAFPEAGETDHATKPLSNEQFFAKVGQALITALDQNTVDGFVFRVDMRLRPYGESGALAHNFSALEQYYQMQGRDWERYAFIKARPVTGDPRQGEILMDSLRPFVFRRYIDFGVIESLRGMKQMINAEVRRRNLGTDVKLGHGGIREVEFIAQCFQLIRGGRDLGLQQRELLCVLSECADLGCLPGEVAEQLRSAYLFLRDSEHAIQGYADKQSQALPESELAQAAMASTMGFKSWERFSAELARHREIVSGHFRELIAVTDEQDSDELDDLPWGKTLSQEYLSELGFKDIDSSLNLLQILQSSPTVVTLQSEGKKRLEEFMPQLLSQCVSVLDPDLALARVLPLVAAVLRRSAYFSLLLENPQALRELVVLCSASPWIAELLAKHPVLLDELLDRTNLYSAPDRALLQQELRQQVARLNEGDLEAQMDALRYFKASHVLRVAASEIEGRLPLMQVSDKLTWIAEVILEQVLAVAWADLSGKYGEPEREGSGIGFAIFGYGKLGGIELSYGSDLDLVFVYDTVRGAATNGERSIDNTVFYTRLGQKIIHILDTRMALGQLYEVDMRLRPSGNSGMLVITTDAFESYQRESAWTWEHQALVRARWVAGDSAIAQRVESVRHEVLSRARDEAALSGEVIKMRDKMRGHLLADEDLQGGEFHLKQGAGGIVDIEFMVQYAVLAWSHQVAGLTAWSDNVRILETLGKEGFFDPQVCDVLTQAYIAYRSAAHQLSLQQQPDVVAAQGYTQYRRAVRAAWVELFANVVPEPIIDLDQPT